MRFANPEFLLLFIPLIAIFWWQRKKFLPATILYSKTSNIKQLEDKKSRNLYKISKSKMQKLRM